MNPKSKIQNLQPEADPPRAEKWLVLAVMAFVLALCGAAAEAQAIKPNRDQQDCKIGDYSVAEYERQSPDQRAAFVEAYRQKYSFAWKQALEALRAAHENPPFQAVGRLKTLVSIQEKISRRKYRCFSQLTDIAGTRLIIPNYAALPLVTQNIESQFVIHEKEDLIKDVRATRYRAIHYLAWVEGRLVEIQIHTYRGTLWAEASHRLVYKGPFADNPSVISYLDRLSDVIFLLDSGLPGQIPEVPEALPPAAKESLKKTVAEIKAVSVRNLADVYRQIQRDMLTDDFFALDEFENLPVKRFGP
jgi:ppGpp synthetase/RelA/SpoT-type nucleotidyltranferase